MILLTMALYSLCRYTQLYREGGAATSFWVLLRGKLQLSSFSGVPCPVVACDGNEVGVCLGTECVSGLPTYSGGGALYESVRERGTCLGEDRRQHTVSCLGLCELVQFEGAGTASPTRREQQLAQRGSAVGAVAAARRVFESYVVGELGGTLLFEARARI